LILLLATAACHAQGLFSVPSGDTLKQGTLSEDLELDGGPRLRSPKTLTILAVRYGLVDWLTVGEDFLLTETVQGQPNFSLGLYDMANLAIAGGYENVGVRSFGEQPYLSASLKVGSTRLHAGWTRSNHDSLMTGVEYAANGWLSIQADTITGRDNYTTAGFQVAFGSRAALSLGYMHANDRRNGDGIFLDLNWTLTSHGAH
jgi:hypothetical protein